MKSGNLNFLEPCGPLQACNGTALPFNILYEEREGEKTNRKTCALVERYSSIENKDPNDTDGGGSGFRCLSVGLIASHYAHFFVQ